MSTFEMDARYKGFSEGVKQTAKLMKLKNFDTALIKEITGLSEAEIENRGIEASLKYSFARNDRLDASDTRV